MKYETFEAVMSSYGVTGREGGREGGGGGGGRGGGREGRRKRKRESSINFHYRLRYSSSVSFRSFCKRGHNGLFKILRENHVVWACEAQIPRGGHVGFKRGVNAPRPPK